MNLTRKIVASSIARTSYTLSTILIAFFMMPELIRALGQDMYGKWEIIGGIAATFYLLDFGLSDSVTRFVAKYVADEDDKNINEVINTSLIIYAILGLLVFVASLVIAYMAGTIIDDANVVDSVKMSIIIVGIALGSEFPFKACSGIIGSYFRYDLLTYSHFLVLLTTTSMVIYFVLYKNHGIVTMAFIQLVGTVISNILYFYISKHLFKGLKIDYKYFNKSRLKELFHFSTWSFISNIATQVRLKIDIFVIGAAISTAMVTHYVVGAKLIEYFIMMLLRATNLFMPLFTRYYTKNQYDEIKEKTNFLTKINILMVTFGAGMLIMLGESFIERWMGKSFLDAYPVLVVLVLAMSVEFVSTPLNNLIYATGKPKYLAKLNSVEAFFNFILSITLVQKYGMIGVALGTMIPLLVARIIFLPAIVSKLIQQKIGDYFLAVLRGFVPSALFIAVVYLSSGDYINIPEYDVIFLFPVVVLPFYIIFTFVVCFTKRERMFFYKIVKKI